MDDPVQMIGVEAEGLGLTSGKHAATLGQGSIGVLHGSKSYVLQDDDGQILEAHSISAGLDYPGVGPEHALLKDLKRAVYHSITDRQALDAFQALCRLEGIIPALESSHALAYAMQVAPKLDKESVILVNLSGRGDKDLDMVLPLLTKETSHESY
jgi:tryptophan synthase beta chain